MAIHHSNVSLDAMERQVRLRVPTYLPYPTKRETVARIAQYRSQGFKYWPNPDCDNQRPDGSCAGHTED